MVERHRRIRDLFVRAVELGPTARAAFLEASDEDPSIRAAVQELLESSEQSVDLAENVVAWQISQMLEDHRQPLSFGPYKTLRVLGPGGMGIVYLAVRGDDEYRKQVAIKVVGRALGLEGGLRRFRTERQILADLEHPNIARLLDGGTTESGTPYVVMEYVDGIPIDQFCDTHDLTVAQRLRLFRTVCSAVEFAHKNLVVHRDIKPGNVLVTAEGVPKLLDFGIAKLLREDPISATSQATETLIQWMTPEYASPEQVQCRAIATASDVYSLGALLYLLLTGRCPHQFHDRSPAAIERVVCEVEPAKPSSVLQETETAASETGSRKASVFRERRGRIEGDLDNIILKALRKEPAARYASVAEFSEDIRRYLENRPVTAHMPTFGYRFAKYARRNFVPLTFATIALALLVFFLVSRSVQLRRTARERDKAQQVLKFMIDTFRVPDPQGDAGSRVTAREILDQGAGDIAARLKGQPEAQAALMDTIGVVYMNLGLYESAQPLVSEALRLREEALGGEHLDVATSLKNLANLHYYLAEYDQAEPLLLRCLDIRRRLLGKDDPEVAEVVHDLAALYQERGEYERARELYGRSLSVFESSPGPNDIRVARVLNNLAGLEEENGHYDEAIPYYERALNTFERTEGPEHPDTARALGNLGIVYSYKGEYDRALQLHLRALAIRRKALGPEHPEAAGALGNIAEVYYSKGAYEEALDYARQALEIKEKVAGPDHPDTAKALGNLAEILRCLGRIDEAMPLVKRAVAIEASALGPDHPRLATSLNNLGVLQFERGLYEEALESYGRSLEIGEKTQGPEHPETATTLNNIGYVHYKAGSYREAIAFYERAIAIREKALGPAHLLTVWTVYNLAKTYESMGRNEKALELAQRALEVRERVLGAEHPDTRKTMETCSVLLRKLERYGEAAELESRIKSVKAKGAVD